MMERMKIFNGIMLTIIICIAISLECCPVAAASGYYNETYQYPTELLLVIDTSGSMSEEKDAIMQTIKLVCSWAQQEAAVESTEIVLFNETAEQVLDETWTSVVMKGDTCILAGMLAADEWLMEHTKSGSRKRIVFFSDLVVDHSNESGCQNVQEEQDRINEIAGKWDEAAKAGDLEYLFITWKGEETTDQNNKNSKNIKFKCRIQNQSRVCDLSKYVDASDGKKQISKVEMAGEIMCEMLKTAMGVSPQNQEGRITKKGSQLAMSTYYEAFVLVENGILMEYDAQGESCVRETDYGTKRVSLYHIWPDDMDRNYRAILNENAESGRYYCIVVPAISGCVYPPPGKRLIAGQQFNIYCKMDVHEEDYRYALLQGGIWLEITDEKGNRVWNGKMEKKNEEYRCAVCIEEEGSYQCIAVLKSGQTLATQEVTVQKGKNIQEDENVGKLIKKILSLGRNHIQEILDTGEVNKYTEDTDK